MIKGFFMAWGMFTAIPCPVKVWEEKSRRWMLHMLPLVGFLLGGLWLFAYWLLVRFEVPAALGAALLTVLPLLLTGGIHLEGYMDVVDALSSHREKEEMVRILKDPHVGSFAVIHVVMLSILTYGALWQVVDGRSFGIALLYPLAMGASRAFAVGELLRRSPIKESQYRVMEQAKKEEGRGKYLAVDIVVPGLAVVLSVLVETGVFGGGGLARGGATLGAVLPFAVIFLAGVVCLWAARHFSGRMGGVNGDMAGYAVTLSEGWCILLMGLSSWLFCL